MKTTLTALALLAACAGTKAPMPEPSEPNITGLWSASYDGGDGKSVEIVVSESDGFRATVNGETVAFDPSMTASFADGASLRLRAAKSDSAELRGHWVQPASAVYGYQSATPIRLGKTGESWRGIAAPLASELELFLSVSQLADGTVEAFIREHGQNVGRMFGVMTVTREESAFVFTRSDGQVAFGATLEGSSLVVSIERLGTPLSFGRRSPDDPGAFVPRAKTKTYAYREPPAHADGWPVANRSDVGIDAAATDKMLQAVIDRPTTTWRTPAIHAILVARRGKLVIEEYFHGHRASDPHDTRSAGKSLASTLVGIAEDRKLLSLTDPVENVLGPTDDPRKKRMTLEHLVTMRSGLECDDNNYDESRGNEDRMQEQQEERDWHRYAWTLPMVREPGAAGVYCSAGINLLGAPLAKATSMWIPDFFATSLAEPLGIDHYHFNLMPTGEGYLGGGIRLRPRDFAKLGQVFLSGGMWNGRRIVSADWVARTSAPHASINSPDDYGYAWWRQTFEVAGKRIDTYFASGNGGQMVFVVSELELVVAIMAGNYGDGRTRNAFRDQLMQSILSAAISTP